jgi:hypothetical protein
MHFALVWSSEMALEMLKQAKSHCSKILPYFSSPSGLYKEKTTECFVETERRCTYDSRVRLLRNNAA